MSHAALAWLANLGGRFFSVAPKSTLLGAFCAVTSQVLLAVASFLPFKALSLAVRDISDAEQLERRILITLLCLLAFTCYAVHLWCKRHLDHCVSEGTLMLLQRTSKLGLFDKQESIAESGYRRFSLGLASLVISLICLAILAIWNRPLFCGVLVYLGLALAVIGTLSQRSRHMRHLLENRLEQLLETLGGLGFVSSFIYLVVEFIGTQHALMIGIGSLIVVRQLFRNLVVLLRAGTELVRKRLQLGALFFHHQVLVGETEKDEFWDLLVSEQRDGDLQQVLQHLLGPDCHVQSVDWRPSGTRDVVALVATVTLAGEPRSLYLRLFNRSRADLARHEAVLLCTGVDLPPSGFLGTSQLRGGFHCHVFDITGYQAVEDSKLGAAMTQLRRQLLYRAPPADLVSTYGRSKPYLWQRLMPEMAVRLRHLLGSTEHAATLKQFETELPAITGQLRRLPLGFVQPDMGKHNVLCNARSRALLCSWDRWELDGLGFGWPAENDARLDQLQAAMVDAATQRGDLSTATIPVARLCALLGAFEQRYLRQDYSAALQLLVRAMQEYQSLAPEKLPGVQE